MSDQKSGCALALLCASSGGWSYGRGAAAANATAPRCVWDTHNWTSVVLGYLVKRELICSLESTKVELSFDPPRNDSRLAVMMSFTCDQLSAIGSSWVVPSST